MLRRKSPEELLDIAAHRLRNHGSPASLLLGRIILLEPFDYENVSASGFLCTKWEGSNNAAEPLKLATMSLQRRIYLERSPRSFYAEAVLSQTPATAQSTDITPRQERLSSSARHGGATHLDELGPRKKSDDHVSADRATLLEPALDIGWAGSLVDAIEAGQLSQVIVPPQPHLTVEAYFAQLTATAAKDADRQPE